jgi:F-type H+-transporting ATPase subunit epsilon
MADTMQFDLVSPERLLASVTADAVEIPGSEGDFTAMPDHAPFLTTLRPGLLKVKAGSDVSEYVVTGGFVEVSGTATSVLAEHAVPKGEMTRELFDAMLAEAEEATVGAAGIIKDLADKHLADTRALADVLSL